MNVTDTKPLEKCCSKCAIWKIEELFIPKRNVCKTCRNERSRDKYKLLKVNNENEKECIICKSTKLLSLFIKNRNICVACNNDKRRLKYKTDDNYRSNAIKMATIFKQKLIISKKQNRDIDIGIGNIKCKYCHEIKLVEMYRHNRLKCKDCERDEPISRIIRNVRSRILSAIKRKSKHTIMYLGCNCNSYLKWILNDERYTFDNYGSEWHIDHVIPVSRFDITNEEQQLIAFNWRNTIPLSAKENLKKNNKIIKLQISQHYKKLLEYHEENKLDLPQVFIDLFAKHLVAGSP